MIFSWGNGGNNMSQKKQTLSAVVIAKNEGTRISKCLAALSFADEIIVIDNSSTDDTASLARKAGARVKLLKAEGFAKLRNSAAKEIASDWVLYVDADEVVSPQLASAITRVISGGASGQSGFEIYRKNYYLGELWPTGEWMLRLFRKEALVGWQGELHETAVIKGSAGRIKGDLLHDTHRTLSEMVEKTNEWSKTEAELRLAAHHPPITWWRMVRVILTGFWQSFIGQRGFRAGTVGWIESMYQGFSLFITYAKLWELQQKRSNE